jgi:hypothetical protein
LSGVGAAILSGVATAILSGVGAAILSGVGVAILPSKSRHLVLIRSHHHVEEFEYRCDIHPWMDKKCKERFWSCFAFIFLMKSVELEAINSLDY